MAHQAGRPAQHHISGVAIRVQDERIGAKDLGRHAREMRLVPQVMLQGEILPLELVRAGNDRRGCRRRG